ncbi:hypothetical protein DOY81_000123 [Sarcophaga bullata]|nr:hypothetical protein DOY81_000123 [Sarcophaga bullata]
MRIYNTFIKYIFSISIKDEIAVQTTASKLSANLYLQSINGQNNMTLVRPVTLNG